MLSPKTTERIVALAQQQTAYQPADSTRRKLANKTLVMMVGATCMGKSTVMQAVHALDPAIQVVGTTTTRPPRPDDDTSRYTYYDHSDVGLAPLLDAIEQGNVVQYVVNPRSGHIYASRVEDYPGAVNIGDYFSSVVETFSQYGFQTIIPIVLITEPDAWLRRFNNRFPAGHSDRAARAAEAIESLTWALHKDSAVTWVINLNGKSQVAALSVKNAILGEINQNEQKTARQLAEQCLQKIKEVLP